MTTSYLVPTEGVFLEISSRICPNMSPIYFKLKLGFHRFLSISLANDFVILFPNTIMEDSPLFLFTISEPVSSMIWKPFVVP